LLADTSGVVYQFATWNKHTYFIPTKSDYVWHVSALDHHPKYTHSAIFVTRNSLLGGFLFSQRDSSGHLIQSVDEDGSAILLPESDSFQHRVNLLPNYNMDYSWEGRPMGYDIKICTCEGERLPRFLYRAIHSGYAGNGLNARGMNVVRPDAIDFQIHLENHLKWRNKSLSPFLSATSDSREAKNRCKKFTAHFTSIQLIQIDTHNGEWDHTTSPIWKLRELIDVFQLKQEPYYQNEYLIEQRILPKCVSRIPWDK
jgi:hypothetical protein